MIELPQSYLNEMKDLLKDEFSSYLDSLNRRPYHGLRVNTSKISVEDFLKISPFSLRSIPWTEDGFYYIEEDRPAKHPYYFAGLYYLQEPSAMLPAEVLPVCENDKVLDCCAAPGGKTSKLANKLKNTGLILANDISVSRAQILLRTLENQGVANAYVMAEDITKIDRFSETFDSILIDAPCSGEGMFRKEPDLIRSYREKDSSCYSPIQKQIITAAGGMLKEGGTMVYSTCTFSPSENEEVIEYALDHVPGLKVLPIPKYPGFADGITPRTRGCARLYPHRIEGEGHFVALLQKEGNRSENQTSPSINMTISDPFFDQIDPSFLKGKITERKEKIYAEPPDGLSLDGLRVLRSGLYLGERGKYRFEPSQALAYALNKDSFDPILDLKRDDPRVLKYLKCETISVPESLMEGYILVCVDGFPLGFGILKGNRLKNRYPAAYRYQ